VPIDYASFSIEDFSEIASPALLVWPERVRRNIARMVAQVGGEMSRLRPHVKTHKMVEVVRMQLEAGITKFKCATIAEAEMLGGGGAADVLLAYQPVGPNVQRLIELVRRFPGTSFAALVDHRDAFSHLAAEFQRAELPLRLFVDVDCGMGRTGISLDEAEYLCGAVKSAAISEFAGIHLYDGHLHQAELADRKGGFGEAFGEVEALIEKVHPPTVVGGGSPTFGLHAEFQKWECSPGTTVFWDAGYSENYPDLEYEIAAAVLTRVVSKPGKNRLCLDLGHKAVAAENPLGRRVRFPELPDGVEFIAQNEEHLVIETSAASSLSVGSHLVGIPVHICPTVALHMEAVLMAESGEPTGERWEVVARNRRITI